MHLPELRLLDHPDPGLALDIRDDGADGDVSVLATGGWFVAHEERGGEGGSEAQTEGEH